MEKVKGLFPSLCSIHSQEYKNGLFLFECIFNGYESIPSENLELDDYNEGDEVAILYYDLLCFEAYDFCKFFRTTSGECDLYKYNNNINQGCRFLIKINKCPISDYIKKRISFCKIIEKKSIKILFGFFKIEKIDVANVCYRTKNIFVNFYVSKNE